MTAQAYNHHPVQDKGNSHICCRNPTTNRRVVKAVEQQNPCYELKETIP